MDSGFEGIATGIALSDSMHLKLRKVEELNDALYDITVPPECMVDFMSSAIASDLSFTCSSEDSDPDRVRELLSGGEPDDGVLSRVVSLRFSKIKPFPWSVDTLSGMHCRLTKGRPGYDPGRVRNSPYIASEPLFEVPDAMQPYAEVSLNNMIRTLNESAYHPFISVSLFWNGLELLQPYQGDNRMFHGEVMLAALAAWNCRGMARTALGKHFVRASRPMECARREFLESGNPNLLASVTVDCMIAALQEALAELRPLDVTRNVDGLTATILRRSRMTPSFVMADVHDWVGDISDQAFRSRISTLTELGVLEKVGNTRGSKYRYVDPFAEVRRINGWDRKLTAEDDLHMKRIHNPGR
ncbi:MAG: hypothetical protein Q4Q58_00815 [Thermoplasmata archaeon]|nr:hypothetical protein [Thermoplasmata archaeon]